MSRKTKKWKQPASSLNTDKKLRILALDPGTKNFGIAVVEYCPDKQRLKLIGTNLLANTITQPQAYLQEQNKYFRQELKELERKYGPFDLWIAERFQSRGRGGGNAIECINLMVGSVLSLWPNKEQTFITASTWKNCANRSFSLDDVYDKLGKTRTPHEWDALCLGVYRLSQIFGLNGFSFLDVDRLFNKFLQKEQL